MLLLFIEDEELAFWCLFEIMNSRNWRRFFMADDSIGSEIQQQIPTLIEQAAPRLYKRMLDADAIEAMSLSFVIPQKYIMPIFTCAMPVDVTKHIFDLFIWEQSGHLCLLRVISMCLTRVEEKCLQMSEEDMFQYIRKGTFVQECIEEVPLTDLFLDSNIQ